jgi:hypothetical protein
VVPLLDVRQCLPCRGEVPRHGQRAGERNLAEAQPAAHVAFGANVFAKGDAGLPEQPDRLGNAAMVQFGQPDHEHTDLRAERYLSKCSSVLSCGFGGLGQVPSEPEPVYLCVGQFELEVEPPQGDGVDVEEVRGEQPGRLGLEKRSPTRVATARRWADTSPGKDPPDRAGTYAVAQAEDLALNAAVPPAGILPGQPHDQHFHLVADRRAAWAVSGRSSAVGRGGDATTTGWPG